MDPGPARWPPPQRARPSCGSRRCGPCQARTRDTGAAGGTGDADPAGAAARAGEPRADPRRAEDRARAAAGRLLRHRVPPQRARCRAGLRPADRDVRRGRRRYGFHGLSYEYIASVLEAQAPEIARGRVVAAHLGNGASMCAMRDRVSIASSMGFTALDGLPIGTRCGSIDPGVVLYLIQQRGMSPHAFEELLYKKSGMLGLSDASSDFRDLLASDDPRARFAVEVFCYSAAREIASLAAALGGIDGIVFTAGVGEHAAPVRAAICRACAWLGVALDEAANDRHGPRISAPGSRVAAYVIPTSENIVIARHTMQLIGSLPITGSSQLKHHRATSSRATSHTPPRSFALRGWSKNPSLARAPTNRRTSGRNGIAGGRLRRVGLIRNAGLSSLAARADARRRRRWRGPRSADRPDRRR